MNILEVRAENVDQTGFFCMMSKKKSPGYLAKQRWIKERFSEGMEVYMLDLKQGGRGFIETIPAEYAWRSILAPGYLAIHCIWVVGKSKGQGYGKLLLEHVVTKAKADGYKGVVMVTSDQVWLSHKKLFEKKGFVETESAPPGFQLMLKTFQETDVNPSFTHQWDKKAAKCANGFTVFYSGQCPYISDAVQTIKDYALEKELAFKALELKSAAEVREKSPSAYGVFSIVFNGKLLSYHYLQKKDLDKRLSL